MPTGNYEGNLSEERITGYGLSAGILGTRLYSMVGWDGGLAGDGGGVVWGRGCGWGWSGVGWGRGWGWGWSGVGWGRGWG